MGDVKCTRYRSWAWIYWLGLNALRGGVYVLLNDVVLAVYADEKISVRIESSFTRIVINVLLFASWIFLITIYYNMYYAYIIFFNNMADNLVNLYWLGKCSAVRETTPVVTQRSREASDMPRTKKRKTLLEGGIISSRYIVAAILNMILNMLALKKIAVLLRIFVYCLWFIFLMFYACSLLS